MYVILKLLFHLEMYSIFLTFCKISGVSTYGFRVPNTMPKKKFIAVKSDERAIPMNSLYQFNQNLY